MGITKVKKGSTVTIVVSTGEAGVLVDDYSGKNVEVVEAELQNKGVKVVKTQKKIDEENYEDEDGNKKEVFEGMIVGQSVKEGERILEGNAIELYYAVLIEEEYTKDKIQTFCDDNEITCDFEEVETEEYAAGTIISQSREKGVEVKEGVTLKIKIAVGIPVYTVSFSCGEGAPCPQAQNVKKGSYAVEPATEPSLTGYRFTGWTLNGYAYGFNEKVYDNIQLKADWEKK